ncbi:MAG: SRPBCC domain-containing protein [Actinomycetota bacterium]
MTSFETTAQITADPAHVWATLLLTEQWPSWDPALERVEGELAEGGRVAFHVSSSSRTFTSKVATWEPGRRLVLRGGMPLGLFAGTRTYELTPVGTATRFHMVERFSGPLAPLIVRSIPDLQPSFDAFADGLRRAAESTAVSA